MATTNRDAKGVLHRRPGERPPVAVNLDDVGRQLRREGVRAHRIRRASRIRRGAGAPLVFALLSGCALNTDISKPEVKLPAAYEAGELPGAHRLSAQALDRWWDLFDDAQLTQLIDQALAASPDAKSALGRLREARATYRKDVVGLLPQGDITGKANTEYVATQYKNVSDPQITQFLGSFSGAGSNQAYSGGVDVTWELDVFGRDITAIRAAKNDLAAQRFDYEATRMSLAASVATALFQARGAAIQLEDARENVRIARELFMVGKSKADRGLATSADASRLEADALSGDAQVAQSEALLKAQQRALLVLIGRGGDPSTSLPIEARAAPPPAAPATAPGELLVRRPDVREAEANLRSAAGRLKLDKLALLPTFTLQPSYQYMRQVQPGYTTITQNSAAGVGVTVPFLSAPKLLEEIRAQGARGDQAAATYEKAVQTAYGDAEKSLVTLEADEVRVGLLAKATAKSRFAYDAAREGYDLGLTDLTTLVQAEQGWRTTRTTYTTATTAALVDAVSTFKALGGGWPAMDAGQADARANGMKP
jgi:NodT family efflux transporter outer membrane factor (OMF) lipoprotein